MNKPYQKILLLLPFVALSIILFFFANIKELSTYNSSFVTTALGLATFSISFSFLQYQFSPYKALLSSISLRHLVYCYFAVLIALIPLAVLIINRSAVPTAGIFCIPLLGYGAIILPIIANEETDPILLLKALLQQKHIKTYLGAYKISEASGKEKRDKLEFSWPNETPMHDYSSKYNSSVIQGDPFTLVRNIVELSIKNGDQLTFERAIRGYLKLIDMCICEEIVDYKSGFRFSVNAQIKETLEVLLGQVIATKNIPLVSFLVYTIGDFSKEKALEHLQTRSPYDDLVQVLVEYAKTALDNNRDGVVYITSLCRQLAQKGIYDPQTNEDAMFFKNHLMVFPQYIKSIGQEAVKQNNSDIVYRCLEDLGFLGCTAVKQNHFQVTIECLQGLVQLGREACANNVQCFWRHCALDMVDHADERIEWMVTWLPGLPEKDRELLAESFGIAYSRLHGKKLSVDLELIGEKLGIAFSRTDEKHIEYYSKGKYNKSVDYSDKQEIKEFKLY